MKRKGTGGGSSRSGSPGAARQKRPKTRAYDPFDEVSKKITETFPTATFPAEDRPDRRNGREIVEHVMEHIQKHEHGAKLTKDDLARLFDIFFLNIFGGPGLKLSIEFYRAYRQRTKATWTKKAVVALEHLHSISPGTPDGGPVEEMSEFFKRFLHMTALNDAAPFTRVALLRAKADLVRTWDQLFSVREEVITEYDNFLTEQGYGVEGSKTRMITSGDASQPTDGTSPAQREAIKSRLRDYFTKALDIKPKAFQDFLYKAKYLVPLEDTFGPGIFILISPVVANHIHKGMSNPPQAKLGGSVKKEDKCKLFCECLVASVPKLKEVVTEMDMRVLQPTLAKRAPSSDKVIAWGEGENTNPFLRLEIALREMGEEAAPDTESSSNESYNRGSQSNNDEDTSDIGSEDVEP